MTDHMLTGIIESDDSRYCLLPRQPVDDGDLITLSTPCTIERGMTYKVRRQLITIHRCDQHDVIIVWPGVVGRQD